MVTLTADFPISMTDDETMLAPFEIWEVPYGDSIIKFHEPLILTPTWMPQDPDEPDDVEYLDVIYPELAIDVYGEDRDDVLEAVYDNICMNWKNYVQREDSRHSQRTKAIKYAFLAVAEVVDE
jgi:hypothetical protein